MTFKISYTIYIYCDLIRNSSNFRTVKEYFNKDMALT